MADNRFPDTITPALSTILNLDGTDLKPLADVFRAAGHKIADGPGCEAAFVRFQLIRLAVQYPEFLAPPPVKHDLSDRVETFRPMAKGWPAGLSEIEKQIVRDDPT